MIIGIDGSRAFLEKRTGIEEYSFQVTKHLHNKLDDYEVRLYLRKSQKVNFDIPSRWKIKKINWPFLWTQIGLSLEMLFHPVDVLFVPAHVVPLINPQNTIVVVHGLEFEFIPKAYSFWARMYMRWSIKSSCRWAKKIIAVSENTKKDLIKLYKVPEEKIDVIYEGCNKNFEFLISNFESISNDKIFNSKYILFVGRLEERKNIIGILEAYKILKEKYKIAHRLILAGSPGYKYEFIKLKIKNLKLEINELGYVDDALKYKLLSNADVFLFPTFYEGFGLPILEAQVAGAPVVASNNSSILEVAGESAILINPKKPEEIAEAVWKILSDNNLREELIRKGLENVQRFSWEKCTKNIAKLLRS